MNLFKIYIWPMFKEAELPRIYEISQDSPNIMRPSWKMNQGCEWLKTNMKLLNPTTDGSSVDGLLL